MPGILEGLFGREVPVGEAQPQPPAPMNVAAPVEDAQQIIANLYYDNINVANNANANPVWAQAQPVVQWNGVQYNPPPVQDYRQQIYPPAVEVVTKLSKEDIEKIAERFLMLWEERLVE